MTIEEAKKELKSYQYLVNVKQQEKQRYDEMCKEYSSIKSGSDETRVQSSNHDYMCDVLDKLHQQQVKAAEAVFKVDEKERAIRDKIGILESPLKDILLKLYIENKSLNKVARELYYDYKWTSHLHSNAIKEYSKLL